MPSSCSLQSTHFRRSAHSFSTYYLVKMSARSVYRASSAAARPMLLVLALLYVACRAVDARSAPLSVVGDPSMRSEGVHVLWEGWNFCNQAGNVSVQPLPASLSSASSSSPSSSAWFAPNVSPRFADCWGLDAAGQLMANVSVADNLLSFPDPLPNRPSAVGHNVNWYAQQKARYLGELCQQQTSTGRGWEWWTIMIKSGNLDLSSNQCPSTTLPPSSADPPARRRHVRPPIVTSHPTSPPRSIPAPLPMNQPLVYQHFTAPHPHVKSVVAGAFLGSFSIDDSSIEQLQRCIAQPTFPSPCHNVSSNISFFSTVFSRAAPSSEAAPSSWLFHHQLVTDSTYPWLMLYQRADASHYYNGGADWTAPGMLLLHELASDVHPHFQLHVFFNLIRCTTDTVQFYLPEVRSVASHVLPHSTTGTLLPLPSTPD